MTKTTKTNKKITGKTKVDLNKNLKATREELRTLRFELASGKVKNVAKIKELRKKVARLLTAVNVKKAEVKDK